MLGGRMYTDGDTVLITDIGDSGVGGDVLLCMTDNTNCCTAATTLAGEFYYPDGSVVGVRASGDSLYRNRGDQFIRLNRRGDVTSPLGRYRCDIPDASGATRSIYINIASVSPERCPITPSVVTDCPTTRLPCTEVTCPTCAPVTTAMSTPCPPTACPTCSTPTCPTCSTCPTCRTPTCPTPTCPTCPTSLIIPPSKEEVYFMLGNRRYFNDDIVFITDIGDSVIDGDALLCVTVNTDCCSNPIGEFYYPDGTSVGFSSTNPFYRNRGEQVVRLNRRGDATSPLGRYRCDIPDASGTTRSIFINIASSSTLCSGIPCVPSTPSDCPVVTCSPPSLPPSTPTTITEAPIRTEPPPTVITIPTNITCNGLDVTYVGDNIFVLELGEFVDVVSERIAINIRVVQLPQSRKRQVQTEYLDVNVTITTTDNYLRVPLEDSLTSEQVYTAQARLFVDNQIVATTAPFNFTYTDSVAALVSPQSAAAISYVDASYIAVPIVLTFLFTAVIVALLVIVLSWLFITLRIKSGRYTHSTT